MKTVVSLAALRLAAHAKRPAAAALPPAPEPRRGAEVAPVAGADAVAAPLISNELIFPEEVSQSFTAELITHLFQIFEEFLMDGISRLALLFSPSSLGDSHAFYVDVPMMCRLV